MKVLDWMGRGILVPCDESAVWKRVMESQWELSHGMGGRMRGLERNLKRGNYEPYERTVGS